MKKIVGYCSTSLPANATLNMVTHVVVERLVLLSPTNVTLALDTSSASGVPTLVNRLRSAGCKVYMDVYTDWDVPAYNNIFLNTTLRAQLIANIVAAMQQFQLDGIDLDWEAVTQSNLDIYAFSDFLRELYNAMPTGKKSIMMAIGPNKVPFTLDAVPYIDSINLMMYDSGTPWYMSYNYFVSKAQPWLSKGIPLDKITMGISFAARNSGGGGWYSYRSIMQTYNPPTSANEVIDTSVPGGSKVYNGADLVKQKITWTMQNGFGGAMAYSLNLDLYGDAQHRGLLETIYNVILAEGSMAQYIFPPKANKTARVPVTIDVTGVPCEIEVWLGASETSQAVTSGKIPFTSTGAVQNITAPVTMPEAGGIYKAFVDLYLNDSLVGRYVDVNEIAIASGTVGPIEWS